MIEPVKKNFDYNIESLRGFASMFVVFHHLFARFDTWLDPNYKPQNINIFETPGHLSVLIFFVLSGYVIGVSQKDILTSADFLNYLKKRFVRLYPIYLISIVGTLAVASTIYSLSTIISHLSFTQILIVPVIKENSVLWSLHYEVLFYLLFIPISFFKINPTIVACLCVLIGLCNSCLYPFLNTTIITSYMYGFTFWLSGLVIARNFSFKERKTNFSILLSAIFLALSFEGGIYNVAIRVLDKLNILFHYKLIFPLTVDWHNQAITFTDFSTLPYCMLFILLFAEKKFKYKKVIFAIMLLFPLLAIFHIIKNHLKYYEYLLPTIYYITSLTLFFFNIKLIETISKKIMHLFNNVGKYSYGLYLIHLPVLFAFSRISYLSGTFDAYVLRLLLYIIIVNIIAFILEIKLQPMIRNYLYSINIFTKKEFSKS